MRRSQLGISLALALSVGGAGPPVLGGQELPWLDGGRIRLDFTPSFWAWDARFGLRTGESGSVVEEVEPLGLDLTANPLGNGVLPYLVDLESALRDALLDDGYLVRLGASQAIVEQSRLVFPIRLDLGITDWLTVGAMVPLIRNRTEISFALDADSMRADVGLVPDAGSFLSAFDAILRNAEASNPDEPAVVQARFYLDALSAAYGHGSVFPVTGSMTGSQLQARLDEVRVALEAAGITGIPETVPLAEAYLTEEDFSGLLTSPSMRAYPLEDWTTPWTLGDVELSGALRLLRHGFRPDSAGNLPFLRFQLGLGALVRLGTGQQADPDRFLDFDPADGQVDFEGSAFGLLELGSRIGAWGRVRYGIQREGEAYRRIASPTEILPPVSRLALLKWTPGDYLDVQLNPRFYFTPEMTFGVRYRFWLKGEDRFGLPPMDPEDPIVRDVPDPKYLNYETRETLQEWGLSATYSTLAAYERGEALLPLHVRFTYFRAFAGAGGQTPKGGRIEAGLTIFRTLWGSGSREEELTGGG
jgi:hypothetical protein